MSYSKDAYSKDVGEVSARYRSAGQVPSVTYPSGTRVVFTAPVSATIEGSSASHAATSAWRRAVSARYLGTGKAVTSRTAPTARSCVNSDRARGDVEGGQSDPAKFQARTEISPQQLTELR